MDYMELTKLYCPYCGSEDLAEYRNYETLHNGRRIIYECIVCKRVFSETKGTFLAGLTKPISLMAQVIEARSEGMGLNATCRTFKIAKNTLLNWEKRFASLRKILLMYALAHTFLSQVIEGDEFYTKIGKNVPVEDCEGWTIILMERSTRFIWEMRCGKKARELFLQVIQTLSELIKQTDAVTLVTDGERRYGNILFEICHEVVRSGKRGRPPQVLPRGVKVRLKNKGSQQRKPGRKRPKYEAPCREHPETVQNVADEDIHAEHVEATNASTRRRNSTCRRKTNTYAKKNWPSKNIRCAVGNS
jgi:transposase-like protein